MLGRMYGHDLLGLSASALLAVSIGACSSSSRGTGFVQDAGNSTDAASSNGCPQGAYTSCNSNSDCACTHYCSPLVPNGVNKVCTIPCSTATDCNRPAEGITCPASDTGCCLPGTNVCLPD
jgi:hypothetical protein